MTTILQLTLFISPLPQHGPKQYQGDESRNESEQKKRVSAYSEDVQQLTLNCHAYFKENCPSQPVKETCKALKISRASVKRIIKRGKVKPANRRKNTNKNFLRSIRLQKILYDALL